MMQDITKVKHTVFAYPPMKRMITFKNASARQEQYGESMAQIEEKCEQFNIHAKTSSRLTVAMPLVSKFSANEAMYLKDKYALLYRIHPQ